MSRHQHNTSRRSATREELVAHYLEVALIVAIDRARSLTARRIDAPRLVLMAFTDNFPEDVTMGEIREAAAAMYQAPGTMVPPTFIDSGEVARG